MAHSSRTYRIGVLTDTHVGDALPALPPGVLKALDGVDLIIHAGDVTIAGVLRELERIAPVVAVRGNHDTALGLRLPRTRVVRIGDVQIGVVHGHRSKLVETPLVLVSILLGRPVVPGLYRALLRQVGRPVDCLVFGHFHMTVNRRVDDTLVFSPGALHAIEADPSYRGRGPRGWAFRRFRRGLDAASRVPAVGILEVAGHSIVARRVPIDGPLRPR